MKAPDRFRTLLNDCQNLQPLLLNLRGVRVVDISIFVTKLYKTILSTQMRTLKIYESNHLQKPFYAS